MIFTLGAGLVSLFSSALASSSAVITTSAAAGMTGLATGMAASGAAATGIISSGSALGSALIAIKTAAVAENLMTAGSLLSSGYMLAKYVKSNDRGNKPRQRPNDEEMEAAIEELRHEFPEATDEELRELLYEVMRLERAA